MKDRYFFDTNILVYAFMSGDLTKQKVARNVIYQCLQTSNMFLSFQVIQEFLNACYKMNPKTIGDPQLTNFLHEVLYPSWHVNASRELYESAIDIQVRWQYSFYDSLIIASAIEADCKFIVSEDFQNLQKIYSTQIMNPFLV